MKLKVASWEFLSSKIKKIVMSVKWTDHLCNAVNKGNPKKKNQEKENRREVTDIFRGGIIMFFVVSFFLKLYMVKISFRICPFIPV